MPKGIYPHNVSRLSTEGLVEGVNNLACPNEYKYTGDGSFAIGGKIPDFTNINGHKKVIEMFGDYFHRPDIFKGKVKIKWHRTEQGCKEIYEQYGFSCLVIWERELKSQTSEQMIARIREFTYATR
jgi:hypothetical protein